jgi:hypothetical protein
MTMSNINILTVAPMLAEDFVEKSDARFDAGEYQQFIHDNKARLGLFGKYLICKFHDSWVINTNISDNLFSVILNDFSTHVFADAIIEKKNLNIEHEKLVFPIQLDFKTNAKATFNEVDDDGNLTEINPVKLDEYLYEQIISIENNKVEIAFEFWKAKPGKRFILLLTATEIVVLEKQDNAWKGLFSSEFDDYYQYFKKHFDSDRYVSDYTRCLELVDEYDLMRSGTNAKQ